MSDRDQGGYKWAVENPLKDPRLSGYLKEVNLWHGYIKYLGLPQLSDHTDTPIQNLFVLPRLSKAWISADEPVESWPDRDTLLQTLKERTFTVVLGDPGGGKSTLINWLTWRLAGGKCPPELGPLVPLPIVLRDINLLEVKDWDSLLGEFLRHPMCMQLAKNVDILENLLLSGQALVLIDGIDEVGDLASREMLRSAIFDGRKRYPLARWILTSRIVGYDELPFEELSAVSLKKSKPVAGGAEFKEIDPSERMGSSKENVLYVCPFDDAQIGEFCSNWYAFRERSKNEAQAKASDLINALKEDRATLRLARTPNLLTMMALLHRVKARLPHGRTLLYEDIAHAYLHTIDDYRKLQVGGDYPLPHKKRWLARVAWELQLKRSHEIKREATMLATRSELVHWFSDSMKESGVLNPEISALEFIDYIAKRSGLLIPRSEDKFAFLHLSFQEYFASIFTLENLESSVFGSAKASSVTPAKLKRWSSDPIWSEVIVFLFELGSLRAPHWPNWLMSKTFGQEYSEVFRLKSTPKSSALFNLLFNIVSNPHIALDREVKLSALVPLFSAATRSFAFLERGWLKILAEEYAGIISKKDLQILFWRKVWESAPRFLDLRDEDFPVIADFPIWENTTVINIETYDQAHSGIAKVFPNVTEIYFFTPESVRYPKGEILEGFANLKQVFRLKMKDIRSIAQSIKDGLEFVGLDVSFEDDYEPILLPNLSAITISGKVKNLKFLDAPKLYQLAFANAKIKSWTGFEGLQGVNNFYFHAVSDIDLNKLFSLPKVKLVHMDPLCEVNIPKVKGWVIKEDRHGNLIAKRKSK